VAVVFNINLATISCNQVSQGYSDATSFNNFDCNLPDMGYAGIDRTRSWCLEVGTGRNGWLHPCGNHAV